MTPMLFFRELVDFRRNHSGIRPVADRTDATVHVLAMLVSCRARCAEGWVRTAR